MYLCFFFIFLFVGLTFLFWQLLNLLFLLIISTTDYRLEKPEKAPEAIFELMQRCWKEEAKERPSFAELYVALDELFKVY